MKPRFRDIFMLTLSYGLATHPGSPWRSWGRRKLEKVMVSMKDIALHAFKEANPETAANPATKYLLIPREVDGNVDIWVYGGDGLAFVLGEAMQLRMDAVMSNVPVLEVSNG